MTFLSIVVMLLGFGFVIFWHELGHFLGARWARVRVEQFAVGMGHALVSFRKGIGLRFGNTAREFQRRTDEEFKRRHAVGEPTLPERYEIAEGLGIGETEYRLSMLPIGGYVKPTGQDDLRPAHVAAADDPKSYAAATVGRRMVIISAGVVMNVILAGLLFFILFRFVGFETTQARVGGVQTASPAAEFGLRAGDELLEVDGSTLHDFTKVVMNVALLPDDHLVDLRIRRDGREQTIGIRPRPTVQNNGLLALGIDAPRTLVAYKADRFTDEALKAMTPERTIVLPGERIAAVEGVAVDPLDYAALDRAVQTSYGRPVNVTVVKTDGASREASFVAPVASVFNAGRLQVLGLAPRTIIASLVEGSSALGKLEPGDVVLGIARGGGKPSLNPAPDTFALTTREAGKAGEPLDFVVLRGGRQVEVKDVLATTKLKTGGKGVGIAPEADVDRPVIGEVERSSVAAGTEGVASGATITSVDGQPVASWHDVIRLVVARGDSAGEVRMGLRAADGAERVVSFTPRRDEVAAAALIRYANPIETLQELSFERETTSTLTALGWGVGETRDLILQGYLTLKRVLYNRTVPASNMSGPVGIFRAGSTIFSERGGDWFIWFLALISANLAVVNFLPIPLLDGWHFLSLVKEKVTGRPVSDRVQEVAQYVGLALILSLLVFVTYNDIMRI